VTVTSASSRSKWICCRLPPPWTARSCALKQLTQLGDRLSLGARLNLWSLRAGERPRVGGPSGAGKPVAARLALLDPLQAGPDIHTRAARAASWGLPRWRSLGALSHPAARAHGGNGGGEPCAHPGSFRSGAGRGLAAPSGSRMVGGPWGVIPSFRWPTTPSALRRRGCSCWRLFCRPCSSIQSCCLLDETDGFPGWGHPGAVEGPAIAWLGGRPARRRVHQP